MLTNRPGAVLLEVIAAMTLLAVLGAAITVLAYESSGRVSHAAEREREVRAADALMHAVALWPRSDLDARLGRRPQGRWFLELQRPRPNLYEAHLTDSSGVVLLGTRIYRRDE
jgi:hypothetical protein